MSHYDKKILQFLGAGPADPGDWMDMNNPYDLLRAEQYVEGFCFEQVIINLAGAGDSLSKAQTRNNMQHLINVRDIGMQMLLEWDRRFPGRLTEWQKRVIAPLSFSLTTFGSRYRRQSPRRSWSAYCVPLADAAALPQGR